MKISRTFSKVIAFSCASLILSSAVFVFAATGGNTTPGTTGGNTTGGFIENPLKVNNLYELIQLIIDSIIIPIGSVIIVMMIIFAGFLFVMAQGNPTKLEDAKKTLLFAVIGAAILLGASAIALIIKNTINQVVAP